jgi:hypothetical protein
VLAGCSCCHGCAPSLLDIMILHDVNFNQSLLCQNAQNGFKMRLNFEV